MHSTKVGNQNVFRKYRRDIEQFHTSRAPYWFSKETMALFGTTVETGILPPRERGQHRFVTCDLTFDHEYAYSVREFVLEEIDGKEIAVDVKTVGEFNGYETLEDAIRAATEEL